MAALRIDLDHARAEAPAARDAADAIRQADAGRRARGRLRRVLAAWRGIGIVVLTLASLPANAEQKPIMPVAPGAFGPGTLPCVNWTDHRQHDRDRVPHLMEQAWVSGYLAALAATGWGNALEDITPIRIFSWLDDYCLSHPRETMAEAAVAFARENAR
jgi:hypothetical protein